MKRVIGGTFGVLVSEVALWPHHHLVALAVTGASLVALASRRVRSVKP